MLRIAGLVAMAAAACGVPTREAAPDAARPAPDAAPDAVTQPPPSMLHVTVAGPFTGSAATIAIPATATGATLIVSVLIDAGATHSFDENATAPGSSLILDQHIDPECDRSVSVIESRFMAPGSTAITVTLPAPGTFRVHIFEFAGSWLVSSNENYGFDDGSPIAVAWHADLCVGDIVLAQVVSCDGVDGLVTGGLTAVGASGGVASAYLVATEPAAYGAAWQTGGLNWVTHTRGFIRDSACPYAQ